jgi:hypothetical protein
LIKTPQREQDLASLAPKPGLVATQPIEGMGRQVGKANKGAREIVRVISRPYCRLRTSIQTAVGLVLNLPRVCPAGASVNGIDDILALLMSLSSLVELKELPGLDLE